MGDQSGLEESQPVDLSIHPSGIVPTLQNIVSTVNLDCKLDLKQIALQARNAEYNPKVCTGAKSEHQSKLAARKCINKILQFRIFSLVYKVRPCTDFVLFPLFLRLVNTLYWLPTCMLRSGFCKEIVLSCVMLVQYEPELFPGLIYRMKQPKIVLLIFVSGKIVITGAKVICCLSMLFGCYLITRAFAFGRFANILFNLMS
ncbi:hypothetical protein C1H46_034016 [Malus baccata]|uniref:Uncharacterized protein n=1 Tax=Malus baccata TaxID=106549 RepID=A0A540L1R4_MALBA|nr:hypothetical protein C1H46_034016 [Malus baccata]